MIYEVTLRVKPLEIVKFDYEVHDTLTLTQDHVDRVIADNEAMVCWTIGRTTILQTRNSTDRLTRSWLAKVRYLAWTLVASFIGRNIRRIPLAAPLNALESAWLGAKKLAYRALGAIGGFSLFGLDKIMNYRQTPSYARYASRSGPSARAVDRKPAIVRRVQRGPLQAGRLPLQHAARVPFHQKRQTDRQFGVLRAAKSGAL